MLTVLERQSTSNITAIPETKEKLATSSQEPAEHRIVVIEGDGLGNVLMQQGLRVLNATGLRIKYDEFNLNHHNRIKTKNRVVDEAAEAMREVRYGYKSPTITLARQGGSANELLRDKLNATVIVTIASPLPFDSQEFGKTGPITIVRMARTTTDEKEYVSGGEKFVTVARTMSEKQCAQVANYAFQFAERENGVIYGGPRNNVSPKYEGIFARKIYDAHEGHGTVTYEPKTFTDTASGLLIPLENHRVIPALERDGDVLTQLAVGLMRGRGRIPSTTLTLKDDYLPEIVMTDSVHGTIPKHQGKNDANPMAMILAASTLLSHMDSVEARAASKTIYSSVMATIKDGIKTKDLGGKATTTEFTNAVIKRMRAALK